MKFSPIFVRLFIRGRSLLTKFFSVISLPVIGKFFFFAGGGGGGGRAEEEYKN